MFTPADGYFAMIIFGLSMLAAEALLGIAHWKATLYTRTRIALPLWAIVMAIYLLFRMGGDWGAI